MKSKWLDTKFKYDGTQLRSLWNYLDHGLLGDSIVAWVGECAVSFDHMVDGEDLLAKQTIAGKEMLHFIVEKFDSTLLAAVGLQRLLASIVMEWLRANSVNKEIAAELIRKGDDIFYNQQKLSISIATQSPTSSLIHFAVNVVNDGTPVPTLCLKDLGIDPRKFAQEVMQAFCAEVSSIIEATQKVKWVR